MKTEQADACTTDLSEQSSLAATISRLKEDCGKCQPLSALACVAQCNTWRKKNQFRKLYGKVNDPTFMLNLQNTLKNHRRLRILSTIAKVHLSMPKIQQVLLKLGYRHSGSTIIKEYLRPLIDVGLVEVNQDQYCATMYGIKISEIMEDAQNIGEVLPTHSEGYEEIILGKLLTESRTYKSLDEVLPSRSLSRILSRMQRSDLIEASPGKDYVFFFKTLRPSTKEKLSSTEKKVYNNISFGGISARKLAEHSGISVRRTYKYIRRLRGKKLVFTRTKPKTYKLTELGVRIATALDRVHALTLKTMVISKDFASETEPPHTAGTQEPF